jgi:cyanophycinase
LALADINRITGIFFAGGDQSKHKLSFLTASGQDYDEMKVIRQRVTAGDLVVSGTSAGTAVQSGLYSTSKVPMIAGGESFESLVHTPIDHVCTSDSCQDDLQYDPTGGLCLVDVVELDTHFSQRGRQGRIIRLASYKNMKFALGIDESTAAVIQQQTDGSTTFEVIGWYGVSLFDLSSASQSDGSSFSISDVYWNYFTHGDKFTISSTGKISSTVATTKSQVRESGYSQTSTDIFSSPNRKSGRDTYMEFVTVGQSLVDSRDTSTYGESYETDPKIYVVDFKKVSSTKGYSGTNTYGD